MRSPTEKVEMEKKKKYLECAKVLQELKIKRKTKSSQQRLMLTLFRVFLNDG